MSDSNALVRGSVVEDSGKPVPGAYVAGLDPLMSRAVDLVRTDEKGAFGLRLEDGRYRITVTALGHLPADEEVRVKRGDSLEPLRLVVHEPSGEKAVITVHGTVADTTGARITNSPVGFEDWSGNFGAVFFTQTDDAGKYRLNLESGHLYTAILQDVSYDTTWPRVEGSRDADLDVTAYSTARLDRPPPPSVLDWLRERAIPLSTVHAGGGDDDLEKLRPLLAGKRIVGLGEATHGTREFFQMKQRLVEFLARDLGFTVFAMEASWPDAQRLNAYVLDGEGDPDSLLRDLGFWIWDTDEVLAMLKWMREYNDGVGDSRKIRFYGLDMQFPKTSLRELLDCLGSTQPAMARTAERDLAVFDVDSLYEYAKLDADTRKRAKSSLSRLEAELLAVEPERTDESGWRSWRTALQHLRILEQGHDLIDPPTGESAYDVRDRSMAANALAILDFEAPDSRIVLWTHNVHLMKGQFVFRTMGSHLSDALGSQYAALGFCFLEGTFRVRDGKPRDESRGIVVNTVSAPPPRYWAAVLAQAGHDLAFFDLRDGSVSREVQAWLRVPRPMRNFGALSAPEPYPWQATSLPVDFDGVFFVRKTTASHVHKRPGRKIDGAE